MVERLGYSPESIEALLRKEIGNITLWLPRVCSTLEHKGFHGVYNKSRKWRLPCLVIFYVGLAIYVVRQSRHHLSQPVYAVFAAL